MAFASEFIQMLQGAYDDDYYYFEASIFSSLMPIGPVIHTEETIVR